MKEHGRTAAVVSKIIVTVAYGYVATDLARLKNVSVSEHGLAVGTWALALVSLFGLWDSEAALEKAQRAWLAPSAAALMAPLNAVGDEVDVRLNYGNTGREPASDFHGYIISRIYPATDFNTFSDKGFEAIKASRKECFRLQPPQGTQVIYPENGPVTYAMTSYGRGDWIKKQDEVVATKGIMEGSEILIITGCLAYRTEGKPHHSAFCFYYNKRAKNLPGGLPFCELGSDAD